MAEQILGLVLLYSRQNPGLTFGQIIQRACGLANPRDVSDQFFLEWLQRATS